MIEILRDLIHVCNYMYMYYITRIPMFFVYEVYIRSCRISIINSMGNFGFWWGLFYGPLLFLIMVYHGYIGILDWGSIFLDL